MNTKEVAHMLIDALDEKLVDALVVLMKDLVNEDSDYFFEEMTAEEIDKLFPQNK